MLRKLLGWLKSGGARTRADALAWHAALRRNASGLTEFQAQAEAELLRVLSERGGRLVERNVVGVSEKYVVADIAGAPLRVFLYADGTELAGPAIDARFEREDAKTPTELIGEFCNAVRAATSAAARGAV